MDDTQRRTQFIKWFEGPPMKGDREKLIRASGYTKGRVSQLFDADQPFGERAARSLAERLGMASEFFNTAAPVAEHAFAGGHKATVLTAMEDLRAPWGSSVDISAAACTELLGSYIAAADTLTRPQIAPLLAGLVETPDRAAEIGGRLQATLAMSPGCEKVGQGAQPAEPTQMDLDEALGIVAAAVGSISPLLRENAEGVLGDIARAAITHTEAANRLRELQQDSERIPVKNRGFVSTPVRKKHAN